MCVYSCICSNFWFENQYGTLHMVHGNMYLHMYGLHLRRRTMIMRMLWVAMGMYVPIVAPSLTLRRCPCVTSVSCNIVRLALTRIHVTVSQSFNPAMCHVVHTSC